MQRARRQSLHYVVACTAETDDADALGICHSIGSQLRHGSLKSGHIARTFIRINAVWTSIRCDDLKYDDSIRSQFSRCKGRGWASMISAPKVRSIFDRCDNGRTHPGGAGRRGLTEPYDPG